MHEYFVVEIKYLCWKISTESCSIRDIYSRLHKIHWLQVVFEKNLWYMFHKLSIVIFIKS